MYICIIGQVRVWLGRMCWSRTTTGTNIKRAILLADFPAEPARSRCAQNAGDSEFSSLLLLLYRVWFSDLSTLLCKSKVSVVQSKARVARLFSSLLRPSSRLAPLSPRLPYWLHCQLETYSNLPICCFGCLSSPD